MEFHFGSVLVTKGQADVMSVVAHEPVIKCKHEIKYVTSWRSILFINLIIHKNQPTQDFFGSCKSLPFLKHTSFPLSPLDASPIMNHHRDIFHITY